MIRVLAILAAVAALGVSAQPASAGASKAKPKPTVSGILVSKPVDSASHGLISE